MRETNNLLDELLGIKPRKRRRRNKDRKRKSRRKVKRMTTGDLSEEVTRKLGEANLLYALEKYDGAIHLLKEVPSPPPPKDPL